MDKFKTKMLNTIDVLQNSDCKKNILVLGDAIFDNYAIGEIYRMSPEAPVPVLSISNTEWRLGGAANVFNNIINLGGNANICTMLGDDYEGNLIKSKLSKINRNIDFIYIDKERKTSKKTRYLTKDKKHLLRVDEEDVHPLAEKAATDYIVNKIKNRINEFDILVISDYAKGFVTESIITPIIKIFRDNNKIVLTDPKSKDITKYYGSYLIKPNQDEFLNFIDSHKSNVKISFVIKQGKKMLNKSKAEYIYVTLGKKGGILIGKYIESKFIESRGKSAIDITGAGDTVIACIALALAAGIEITDAVEFSSYAAGACVQRIGTTPIDLNNIKQLIEVG